MKIPRRGAIWLLVMSAVGHAQTTPVCNGKNVYPCSIGGTLLVLNKPSGLAITSGSALLYQGGGGSFITNPQSPGFSLTGFPSTANGPILPSVSGAFNIATVSGQPGISGAMASITCGVTGAAKFSLTLTTPAGPLVVACPTIAAGTTMTVTGQITFPAQSTMTTTLTLAGTANAMSDTLALGGISVQVQIPSASSGSPSATRFVPVTPCRIADTRNPNGPFGGPSIAGGTTRDFAIPNSVCGIPSTATAYSLNVAVVPRATLGYLTLWPSGQLQPQVATLTSDRRVKSNAAIIPAGANAAVTAYATDTTDLVLDINGYFVPGTTAGALAFYPVTPCRITDTRNPPGPLAGPSLVGGASRTFPILASSCGIPSTAQAYSLSFAAVPKGPLGYLTAWPTGQPQPGVASLNAPTGTVVANAVIVPAGSNGSVDVFATNPTDLVIDVDGYFAPPVTGGLSLYTSSPCRAFDSRLVPGGLPFTATVDINIVSGPCGLPTTAQAYVFNATVVPPGPLGYITLWPQGEPQPQVATLNALDGAITSNLAIVPTTNGSISVFPYDPTQLVLDLFGYFAP